MNALELLQHDHDEVNGLMEKFRGAGGESAKVAAAASILAELKVHTSIEEEIFYPAVRSEMEGTEELIAESVEEHHVVETLMTEIESMEPRDEAWEAKVTVMLENVEHHVGEEESELFPKVQRALGERRLAELGSQMTRRKNELQYEAMSRDALYGLARERGIEGRSDMTKSEIVDALVRS